MTQPRSNSAGFTAVELLITLFVAAAFLVAGYQLFNVVITDGGNTRAESAAGNVAYDYLRRYTDSATNPCAPAAPITGQPVAIDGFDELEASVSVVITCPQTDATTISQVEATVNYGVGDDAKLVKYTTYVDKSRGASPEVDVTEGLIEWWKLNGNTASSAGPTTLVDEGVATTTGQNGDPVGAYNFVAANQRVLRGDNFSNRFVGLPAFSMTGWVYPPSNPAAHAGYFGFRNDSIGGVYILQLVGTNSLECRMRVNGTTYYQPSNLTITPNTWQLVSLVFDGANLRCFVNNTGSTTVSAAWGSFNNTTLPFTIGRTAEHHLNGNIDDVRIYNRALSVSEISQLVSGGAK